MNKNILLNNRDKIEKVLLSCNTKEQLLNCSNWLNSIKNYHNPDEYSTKALKVWMEYIDLKINKLKI
jgi:hypothetical protein